MLTPPAVVDALEEDLVTNTGETEVVGSGPYVRVEIASRGRESNERVAEVVAQTPKMLREVRLSRDDPVEAFDLSSAAGDDVSNSTQESNTDSIDWAPKNNGSVVSGVHESPEPDEVVGRDQLWPNPSLAKLFH